MTLEEAILMALEYEKKVRDAYVQAAEKAGDQIGRKVFETLGKEEQGHIDYLQSRLDEWKKTGKVQAEDLGTVVPPQHVIDAGVSKLDQQMSRADRGSEVESLSKALQLEKETSNFYQNMVNELQEEGEVFARFMEIERGHMAIVQAELDYLNKTGYFFDFQDFGMV
jgi:rubrerythrin